MYDKSTTELTFQPPILAPKLTAYRTKSRSVRGPSLCFSVQLTHAAHILHHANIPPTHIRIERGSLLKHLSHRPHLAHIPIGNDTVEAGSVSEHSRHVSHVTHVPVLQTVSLKIKAVEKHIFCRHPFARVPSSEIRVESIRQTNYQQTRRKKRHCQSFSTKPFDENQTNRRTHSFNTNGVTDIPQ